MDRTILAFSGLLTHKGLCDPVWVDIPESVSSEQLFHLAGHLRHEAQGPNTLLGENPQFFDFDILFIGPCFSRTHYVKWTFWSIGAPEHVSVDCMPIFLAMILSGPHGPSFLECLPIHGQRVVYVDVTLHVISGLTVECRRSSG